MIQGMIIKKSMEINTKLEHNTNFDDFVFHFIKQRFGTKKKINEKGQEFMLGLREWAADDERIAFFKHFLGFEE